MPVLAFKVQADYEKVLRLREEIHKLKEEMKGVDAVNNPHQFNVLNQKIKQSVDEYNKLTEVAAKAGAQIGVASRKQIYDAQQAVNSLTEDIIKQKKIIAETSDKLKVLTDKYKDLKRNGQNIAANSMLPDINKAKKALDEEKFALFDLTQERAKAQLGVKKLREEYALFAKESGASSSIIAKMKSEIMGLGAGMLAGFGLKELGAEIIRVRGQFQQADTAIQTLLGSKEKADALLTKVREYAKISPLEFGDITSATQMMLGFNIEAEKVPGFIKAIGDVSMGEAGRFNSLTLAFSQMSATGKLMGQDLNQMINAGFNPLSVMAEKTGKSVAQLKEEMSKGAITAEMVQQAFIDATSEGGKFFNMSQNAAKTINGQLSMMHDAIDTALNDIGKDSEGVIVDAISGVTKLIENYETLGRVLIGLTATYGTYRTAVALVTFAENGHTLAMTLARAQILLTQKAQALLNTTMLANPYVLAATAIAGLVSAMVLYKKSADEATLVNEKLNKSFGATQAEIVSEQKKIDDLFEKLRKAEVGTNEYKQIKDTILNQYGSYLEGLNNEIATLKDVEGAYKAVAAAARDAAFARGREAAIASANSDYNQKYSEYIGKIYDQLIKKGFNENDTKRMLGWIQGDLKKTGKVAEDTQRALHKYGVEFSWFGELNKAESGLSYETQKINAMFGEQGKVVEETSKKVSKLSEDYKAAERSFRNAKNWLKQIEKNKSDYTTEEYKKALQDYEAKKKAFKDVGGDPDKKKNGGGRTGTKEDIAERVRALNDKQITAQLRAAKDLEFSTREAEIKAMQDGTAKVLAQIELDKDKQEDAIERAYEDMRQKRIDEAKKLWDAAPKNKGKNFFESEKYKEANVNSSAEKANYDAKMKAVAASYKNSLLEQRRAESQSMLDYFSEYGTYQQKKLAIAQKYAIKIAEANKKGDLWATKKLEAQQKAEEAELNFKILQDDIDWETLFSSLDKVSTKHLEDLKAKLRETMNAGKVDPKNAELLTEKILEIENRISQRTNIFESLIPALRERERITRRISELEIQASKAKEKAADANTNYQNALQTAQGVVFGVAGKQLSEKDLNAQKDQILKNLNIDANNPQYKAVSDALDQLKKAALDAASAEEKQTRAQQLVDNQKNILKGFKGGVLGDVFSQAVEAGGGGALGVLNVVNDNAQSLADFSDKIGLAGTDFGNAVHGFADGVSGFQSAISSLANGDVFGFVNGVLDGIAGIGTMFYMGGNEAEQEKAIEKLIDSNNFLESAINRLADRIIDTTATNKESVEAYIEALNAEKEWEKNQREAIDRRASEWTNTGYGFLGMGGKGSFNSHMAGNDWYGWKIFSDILKEHANDFGVSHSSVSRNSIWDLSPEEMALLQEFAPKEWQALLNGDGHRNPSELIDEYIERAGKIEHLTSTLNEKLTGYSWEGFLDSYKSLLKDLTSTTEDFADHINELISNAIIEGFVNSEGIKSKVKNLYEMIAEYAMPDSAGGTELTEDEIKAIREANQDIADTMIAWREAAKQAGLIIGDSSTASNDQTATASMAEKATYDQFDTYLGIATAQQIALEQIKDSISGMTGEGLTLTNMNLEQILSISSDHRDIADESRDILAKSYLELQEANEHLGKIEKSVDRIEASVSKTEHLINDRL